MRLDMVMHTCKRYTRVLGVVLGAGLARESERWSSRQQQAAQGRPWKFRTWPRRALRHDWLAQNAR